MLFEVWIRNGFLIGKRIRFREQQHVGRVILPYLKLIMKASGFFLGGDDHQYWQLECLMQGGSHVWLCRGMNCCRVSATPTLYFSYQVLVGRQTGKCSSQAGKTWHFLQNTSRASSERLAPGNRYLHNRFYCQLLSKANVLPFAKRAGYVYHIRHPRGCFREVIES